MTVCSDVSAPSADNILLLFLLGLAVLFGLMIPKLRTIQIQFPFKHGRLKFECLIQFSIFFISTSIAKKLQLPSLKKLMLVQFSILNFLSSHLPRQHNYAGAPLPCTHDDNTCHGLMFQLKHSYMQQHVTVQLCRRSNYQLCYVGIIKDNQLASRCYQYVGTCQSVNITISLAACV